MSFNNPGQTFDLLSQEQVQEQLGKKKPKKPAVLRSRSDLSATRTESERESLFDDKSICWGNKGFYGTHLPLIPDIRKSEDLVS